MNIKILSEYIEICEKHHIEPSFDGLISYAKICIYILHL